jgi:hypothetical protein
MFSSFCKHPNYTQVSQTMKRRTSSNTASQTEVPSQLQSTAFKITICSTSSNVSCSILQDYPTESTQWSSAITLTATLVLFQSISTHLTVHLKIVHLDHDLKQIYNYFISIVDIIMIQFFLVNIFINSFKYAMNINFCNFLNLSHRLSLTNKIFDDSIQITL